MSGISLRELNDNDIALLENWLYVPHVSAWYLEPLDWINEIKKRKFEFSFLYHFIVLLDEKPIGFCQFYKYYLSGETWHGNCDINETYSIDYLISDTSYLGKGYEKAIVSALIKKIKNKKMQNTL